MIIDHNVFKYLLTFIWFKLQNWTRSNASSGQLWFKKKVLFGQNYPKTGPILSTFLGRFDNFNWSKNRFVLVKITPKLDPF